MTISKYNAQTCKIVGFEKGPVPCLVWDVEKQELQLLGSLNILAYVF